jgi:DNA mismatch endonuclease (patch repair protein)
MAEVLDSADRLGPCGELAASGPCDDKRNWSNRFAAASDDRERGGTGGKLGTHVRRCDRDGQAGLGRARAAMSTPSASTPAVRRRMQSTRRRDTPAELALRRALHAKGLRYRVDMAPLPGCRRRADLVFTRLKVAVFVDGCFWHRCPVHGTQPATNGAWWEAKLAANVARDRDTDRLLAEAGWRSVRIWAHEDPSSACEKVVACLREGSAGNRPAPVHLVGAPDGHLSGCSC